MSRYRSEQDVARAIRELALGAGGGDAPGPRVRGLGFFEAVLEFASVPLAVFREGRLRYANLRFSELLGDAPESVLEGDGGGALADALRSVQEDGGPVRVRGLLPGRGELAWELFPFRQGGTPYVGMLAPGGALLHGGGPGGLLASEAVPALRVLPGSGIAEGSPALLRLLGWASGELQASSWADLVAEEDLASVLRAQGMASGRGRMHLHARMRHRGGALLPCELELLAEGESVLVLLRPDGDRGPFHALPGDELCFRQLFQTMPEAFALHEIRLDAEGHPRDYVFLEVNAAWEAFTGLRADEVRGRSALEVLPGLEDAWIQRYGQVALTGKASSFEQYSGSLGRSFRVFAQCPHLGFFTVLAVDITEEKKRDERLAVLSVALEQSPASVVITDAAGDIEYVNRAFTTSTGYEAEEVLGRNPRVLKSGFMPQEVYDSIWRCLGELRSWRGELCNRRKDGSLFWERVLISPVVQRGRATHYLAVKEDIGRERALELARLRLYEALEHTDEGVAMVNDEGRVILANHAMHRLMVCSCERCPELEYPRTVCNLREFLEGDGHDLLAILKDGGLDGGQTWHGHIERRTPEGRVQILAATARAAVGGAGGTRDLLFVLRDVTSEVQMERHLRQAEKMDALGKLASGVAHDFNNVLTAILAAAELLEWQLPEDSSARGKVEAIRLAARRAQELNRRILSFARRNEECRVPFDLSAVVREVVSLLQATTPQGVLLQAQLSSSIWCTGDANQILQVVMNLAVNGFHAMRERGGTLAISLTEEQREAEGEGCLPEGRYALLTVRDEGCGMAPEVLEQVFEPFFTTKPEGEGTGMGLFVVHGIVHAHKGSISLASRPGGGTTATVLLPCTQALAEAEPPRGQEEPFGQEEVLLVGGEELESALIAQGLRMLGYRVTAKPDPFEALEQIRAHSASFDIAIVEHALRGMTAQAFIQRAKRQRPGLPVLLLSEAQMELPLMPEGGPCHDDQVLMPATPRDIARVLRRTLAPRIVVEGEGVEDGHAAAGSISRILLAEDSAVTRSLLGSWLAKAGYAVVAAKDGQEAWDLFRASDPGGFDALLTDLVMPRLDGLQLLERVRESDANLPIVILSSVEDTDSVKAAVHLRASEYLSKPFTSEALVTCVRGVLDAAGKGKTARRSEETARAVRLAQKALVAIPERDLPVFSISEPFTDAGGDVLRCTRMADGSILFVLADVAGHSVICSYAVASFLGMLSTFTGEAGSLSELALRLNRSVQDGPFRDIPICALLGLWQPNTGRVHVLNTGIPYGLLFRRRHGDAVPVVVNGTPLGIFPEPMVEERVLWLDEGDRLLFGTDGVFEIRDASGAAFEGSAPACWRGLGQEGVGRALEHFCETARGFGEGRVEDDILAMAFEQTPDREGTLLSLWMPSDAAAVDTACARLSGLLESDVFAHLAPPRRFDIALAVREALTNAVLHGNRGRDGAEVHLRAALRRNGRLLEVRVTDEGTGFDLARHRAPEEPLSERGRGIPCMRAAGGRLRMTAGELRMRFELEAAP